MAVIYLGSEAIDRAGISAAQTVICEERPASSDGHITDVEIWAQTNLSSCTVATFYRPDPVSSPNYFTVRDNHYIGNVTAGSKQTFSGLDLLAFAGDYIGLYAGGSIMLDTSGGEGLWVTSGDHTSGSSTFSHHTTMVMSLKGTATVFAAAIIELPTNITRADPTIVTANGSIGIGAAGEITTRGFEYGLTEIDTWSEYEEGTFSQGTFSLQLTGLENNTTYYIRVYVIGWWGTKYTSYLEFTTAIPYGSFESRITAEATASDVDIALVGGERSLAIDNHLIQTQTIADLVAAAYLADYKDQKTKLRITKPTPPPYSIGDTVERISAKLPYAPAVSAVIAYAPATDGLYYYNLAGRDMLIRKLNVSFSAGDYVSVIELEN